MSPEARAAVLALPVDGLEASVRVAGVFAAMGCKTIGDVVAHTESEFLRQPNFGRKSLNELRELLSQCGLALAPDPWQRPQPEPPSPYRLRNLAIYRLWVDGESMRAVARKFHLTASRIGQICRHEERRAKFREMRERRHAAEAAELEMRKATDAGSVGNRPGEADIQMSVSRPRP